MLSASRTSVPDTLAEFKALDIPVSFLVPTQTGLTKSIMDAHATLRDFLRDQGIHDFSQQNKGSVGKVFIETLIVTPDGVVEGKTSLYRPETKNGDPRIWISRLNDHCEAGDLLAITHHEGRLIVLNASRLTIERTIFESHPLLEKLLPPAEQSLSAVAAELLSMLRRVAGKGWITTLRPGDTGVGYTLETELGIPANCRAAPDYKGIELKSHRMGRGSRAQITAFSKVPDWKNSRLKSSKEILNERGYFSEERQRQQVFHEISAIKPNSIGLQLAVTQESSLLEQFFIPHDAPEKKIRDVQWAMSTLQSTMKKKHRETMWIEAETAGSGAKEAFKYSTAVHTTGYDSNSLPILLESGAMTVHYLIKETPTGGAKDQGYLFKVAPKYLKTMFSHSMVHRLT